MSQLFRETKKAEIRDKLEGAMAKLPQVELPVVHRFTPGMYIREISIPAGTMLTSMTHLTEHPFVISKGIIRVTSDNEGELTYEAPYTGITQPGTRRALLAETDVIWTTFHATEETDVDKICQAILEPKDMSLINAAAGKEIPCGYTKSLPNRD